MHKQFPCWMMIQSNYVYRYGRLLGLVYRSHFCCIDLNEIKFGSNVAKYDKRFKGRIYFCCIKFQSGTIHMNTCTFSNVVLGNSVVVSSGVLFLEICQDCALFIKS